jgi:hypothetical protein
MKVQQSHEMHFFRNFEQLKLKLQLSIKSIIAQLFSYVYTISEVFIF